MMKPGTGKMSGRASSPCESFNRLGGLYGILIDCIDFFESFLVGFECEADLLGVELLTR